MCRFLGVDVSADRGLDLALLDERRQLARLVWLPGPEGLGPVLRELGPDLLVGVDAPPSMATARGGRAAEQRLLRLGMSVYSCPPAGAPIPRWMVAGLAVWAQLREAGYPERRALGSAPPLALEVYPAAAYVCWAGRRRDAATSPERWARGLVRRQGIRLPPWASKDQADAAAAALVAAAYRRGEASPIGDPNEGVIWLPTPLPPLLRSHTRAPNTAAAPASR